MRNVLPIKVVVKDRNFWKDEASVSLEATNEDGVKLLLAMLETLECEMNEKAQTRSILILEYDLMEGLKGILPPEELTAEVSE